MPEPDFVQAVRALPSRLGKRRAFMTERHVRVREYVVREMRGDERLTPERIGAALHLPVSVVTQLLTDLERNLFFLVRANDGAVTWAFPLTVERTPHQLTFAGGDRLYGACGEDTIAAPFVQGQLRKEHLEAELVTECGHCQAALHLAVTSDLRIDVRTPGAEPLVFEPEIDWHQFAEPNILDAY